MLCLHHIGCLKIEVKLECAYECILAIAEVKVNADNNLFDKVSWVNALLR